MRPGCACVAVAAAVLALSRGAGAADWSYVDGRGNGPATWVNAYPECGGTMQSPIDVETRAVPEKAGVMKLWIPRMSKGSLRMYRAEGNIILDVASRGAILTISTMRENLLLSEIRLRSPAEHYVDGVQNQAEAQFMFETADHATLSPGVKARAPRLGISVLFHQTAVGDGFGLVKYMIEQTGKAGLDGQSTDITWSETDGHDFLLPTGEHDRQWLDFLEEEYYEYEGGLTVPPCTEAVRWMIVKKTRSISRALLKNLEDAVNMVNGNVRPPVASNGRRIVARHYDSSVGRFHETEFPELQLVTAQQRSLEEAVDVTPTPMIEVDADDSMGGLLAAVIILPIAIIITVIATVFLIKAEPMAQGETDVEMREYDDGDDDVEEEEDEEDEEEEEEDNDAPLRKK